MAWPSAQRATAPALSRPTPDNVTDSHDVAVTLTVTSDLCRMTPAKVMSSSVSFAPPYDRSARNVVNVSPSSQLSVDIPAPSAVSEKPSTLSEKPPPPYPGRAPVHTPPALRPAPPPPPTDNLPDTELAVTADDSTDEDVAMTTECQRIESPKPVRRPGDDNRCETKVPADHFVI